MKYNIRDFYGKLGDSLQFSGLAERLVQQGHEVSLYTGPDVMPFRNQEIKKFVWDTNPFVVGASDLNWNAGDIPSVKYENLNEGFIGNWEKLHDLPPPYNKYPKIYHKPNKIVGVDALIELSSITLKYDFNYVKSMVQSITKEFSGLKFEQLVSPNQENRMHIPFAYTREVNNLFEIWDLLCSCKMFISLNSGLHSLAAAAFKYNPTMQVYCLLPVKDYDWIMRDCKFIYPGFTYLREDQIF